jgi:type VI secretion system secreted protein VgrG
MNRSSARLVTGVALAALVVGLPLASAQTNPPLGAAQSYAVLAASTVTNTGSSVVSGDLGVSPGSAVVGFPPGTVVSGTIHAADAAALAAQNSTTTAYNDLAGQACTQVLTGQDLGSRTLTAGVYCYATSAQLTGTLTLDAQGDPGAVFVFKTGSTLTTASGASVVMSNSASPCNVYWQVGSSATLGTSTSFAGSILALTSITLNTGANATGRLLARTGAVTLDTNNVSVLPCALGPVPTLPEWGVLILVVGLASMGYVMIRRRRGMGMAPVR